MGDLGFLGVAGLGEDCEEDDRAAGREPVGDAGLLGKQVEPQFADLASQVAGVGLAKTFYLLGEQSDEEVGSAEVPVAQALQPGPDLGLDLYRVQTCYASNAICIRCYCQSRPLQLDGGLLRYLRPYRRRGCSSGAGQGSGLPCHSAYWCAGQRAER